MVTISLYEPPELTETLFPKCVSAGLRSRPTIIATGNEVPIELALASSKVIVGIVATILPVAREQTWTSTCDIVVPCDTGLRGSPSMQQCLVAA